MLKCYTLSAIKTTQQFCMNSSKYHKQQQSYVCIFFPALVSDATIWWCFIFYDQNKICWNIFFPHSQKKHIFIFRKNTRNKKKTHRWEKSCRNIFYSKICCWVYRTKKNATTNPKLHQNNMSTTYGANVGFSSMNLVRRIYEYLTCNISKLLESEGTEGWTD